MTTAAAGLIFAAQAPSPVDEEGLLDACGEDPSVVCEATWEATHNPGLTQAAGYASDFIAIALILLVAWLVQRVVRRFIRRVVSGLQGDTMQRRLSKIRRRTPRAFLNTTENSTLRRAQRAETIGALLRSVSTIIVGLFAFFAILRVFAVNLGPLIAGAGIATAALAFGAQNIIRDFLAGFFIVVEDQYGVGDVINVGEAEGLVESVSLRSTRLRAADGTLWHVPNGEIKRVANKSQQWSRAVMDFRVALDSDIPTAIKVIKREADDMWHDSAYAGIVLEEPEVWGPEEVNAMGILLKLAVKTKPLEQWQISRTLRSRVKKALDEAGIAIAVPHPMNYGVDAPGPPKA